MGNDHSLIGLWENDGEESKRLKEPNINIYPAHKDSLRL